MAGLFGSKIPAVKEPPPPPSVDEAAQNAEQADALRRRRGRAAAIYTGSSGSGTPKTTAKSLLGG